LKVGAALRKAIDHVGTRPSSLRTAAPTLPYAPDRIVIFETTFHAVAEKNIERNSSFDLCGLIFSKRSRCPLNSDD